MSNMNDLDVGPAAMAQQNREAAIHMERIAAMLRMDQQDHGMAELTAARKACADELRAAAEMLNPQEPTAEVTVKGPPEKSSTEIVIHGIHKDMTEEHIAHILGGGQWVRMVRLAPQMAFVSYWTEKGQKRGLKDGVRWIREEDWTAQAAEPASFNPGHRMFEIDEEAEYPPFRSYPKRDERNDEDAANWATTSTTTMTQTSWQSGWGKRSRRLGELDPKDFAANSEEKASLSRPGLSGNANSGGLRRRCAHRYSTRRQFKRREHYCGPQRRGMHRNSTRRQFERRERGFGSPGRCMHRDSAWRRFGRPQQKKGILGGRGPDTGEAAATAAGGGIGRPELATSAPDGQPSSSVRSLASESSRRGRLGSSPPSPPPLGKERTGGHEPTPEPTG